MAAYPSSLLDNTLATPRSDAPHEAVALTRTRSGHFRRRKAFSAGPIKSTTSQSSPLANFSNARRVGWLPPRSSRPTYERSKPEASASCSCDISLSKRLSRAAAPSIFATFSSKLRAPLGRPDFGAVFGRIGIRPRLQEVSYLRHVIYNSNQAGKIRLTLSEGLCGMSGVGPLWGAVEAPHLGRLQNQ